MKELTKTQSICPICQKPLMAAYVEDDGQIYFRKTCEEHGAFQTLAAPDAQAYASWIDTPVINVPPKAPITQGAEGECPLHCGTCTQHLQTACCVLLDVTDRCNQHCPYCFARAEADASRDPDLAVIAAWYDKLLELGEARPFNIQLSGGEPTVRDDLPEIIRMGREKGFDYIQLNTNGRRIAHEAGYAETLKQAGVSVVFLQFDGLTDDVYQAMRGEALLAIKLQAIQRCREARIPVTLVPTVARTVNLHQVGDMIKFMLAHLDVVKGVHFQPVSFFGRHPDQQSGEVGDFENRVTMFDVMTAVEEQTKGMFAASDLLPISTGHPLCCFTGSYLREQDGTIRSLMRQEQRESGVGCCCGEEPDPLEIIKRDRDFVLNRWEVDDEETGIDGASTGSSDGASDRDCGCGETGKPANEPQEEIMGFDQFISYYRRNSFTLSGMAFMDTLNLDAERLKRCRVQVFTADERLIPFCSYNSIYRGN